MPVTNLLQKAQAALAATTLTDIKTCPTGYLLICTVFICNRDSVDTTFRLAIAPAGAANDNKHYLYYDVPLRANDTLELQDFPLQSGDVLRAYAAGASVSINVTPTEARTMSP